MTGFLDFDQAFVQWDDKQLIMGNGVIRRVIDLSRNYSCTRSITLQNEEFASPEYDSCDCSFFGINSPDRKKPQPAGTCTKISAPGSPRPRPPEVPC